MDLLSRLLSLMPVSGRLDERCHFGAPWRIEHGRASRREVAYHVLLAGEATVEDGQGASAVLQAGDVVMFPSGVAHTLHDGSGRRAARVREHDAGGILVSENTGKGQKSDLLCGTFRLGAVPDRLLREFLPGRLIVSTGRPASGASSAAVERLHGLVQWMRDEADELRPGSAAVVSHLSGVLFALTMRAAAQQEQPMKGLLALAGKPRLQPAVAAMFDTPERPWSLPDLASLCHMSRATFARHFDEALGRSASDVLTEIRMTKAGRMLASTDLPVGAVGEAVGYQSEAAFQRVFKRHVGVTPSRWRASTAAGEVP